jgi:hypothetical protein
VKPETVKELTKIHATLCGRWTATRGRLTEDLTMEGAGGFTINTDQQALYKIRPLFHALILITEDPIHDYTEAKRENSI